MGVVGAEGCRHARVRGNRSELIDYPHVVDLQPQADGSELVVAVRNDRRESDIVVEEGASQVLDSRTSADATFPSDVEVRSDPAAAVARRRLSSGMFLFELRGRFVKHVCLKDDPPHPAVHVGDTSSHRVFLDPDEDSASLFNLLGESDNPNCRLYTIRSREGLLFAVYTQRVVPAGSPLTILRRVVAADSSTLSRDAASCSVGSSTAQALPKFSPGTAKDYIRLCRSVSFSVSPGHSSSPVASETAVSAIEAVQFNQQRSRLWLRRGSAPVNHLEGVARVNDLTLKEVKKQDFWHVPSSAGVSGGSNESVEKPLSCGSNASKDGSNVSSTSAAASVVDSKSTHSSLAISLEALYTALKEPSLDKDSKLILATTCLAGVLRDLRLRSPSPLSS